MKPINYLRALVMIMSILTGCLSVVIIILPFFVEEHTATDNMLFSSVYMFFMFTLLYSVIDASIQYKKATSAQIKNIYHETLGLSVMLIFFGIVGLILFMI
jgi:prolipoprotein diacylglyceryltransferase